MRALLSGALLVATAWVGVPSADADTAPYAFCARRSAAQAYIVGSVWADGGIDAKDRARFKTTSTPWADSLVAAAACADQPVTVTRVNETWQLRFDGITGAMVNQAGLPPALKYDGTPEYLETRSFLAAVIQSEGGRTTGLVVDDTHEDHVAAVQPMLDRVGVRWFRVGMKLFSVEEDWVLFADDPFVVWWRVPGFQHTWWP